MKAFALKLYNVHAMPQLPERRQGEVNAEFRGRVNSSRRKIIDRDGLVTYSFAMDLIKSDGTVGKRMVFIGPETELAPDTLSKITRGREISISGHEYSKRRHRKNKGWQAEWRISARSIKVS